MDKIISVCAYRQAQIVGIFRARWLILKSNHIRGDLLVISIIMIREHANAGMPSRKYPLFSPQLYTENYPPLCLQVRIISVWLRSRYTNNSFQNCRSVHSVDISPLKSAINGFLPGLIPTMSLSIAEASRAFRTPFPHGNSP